MREQTRGTPTSHVTIRTGQNRRLIFLRAYDYRLHLRGAVPKGYRPTLGQRRRTRADLRFLIRVLPGGKAQDGPDRHSTGDRCSPTVAKGATP